MQQPTCHRQASLLPAGVKQTLAWYHADQSCDMEAASRFLLLVARLTQLPLIIVDAMQEALGVGAEG